MAKKMYTCWNCKKTFPKHNHTNCIYCGKEMTRGMPQLNFHELKLLGQWYRGSHHWGKCENSVQECHRLRNKLYRMQDYLFHKQRAEKKNGQ